MKHSVGDWVDWIDNFGNGHIGPEWAARVESVDGDVVVARWWWPAHADHSTGWKRVDGQFGRQSTMHSEEWVSVKKPADAP